MEEYQRGLHDAWDIAKKMMAPPELGGFHLRELVEIFGSIDGILMDYVFTQCSIEECMRKIRRYEEKQDRIKRESCKYFYYDDNRIASCSNPEFEDAENCIPNCIYYEPKQLNEDIKAGDEIIFVPSNIRTVVTKVETGCYTCLNGINYLKKHCKKTGIHFNEIDEVWRKLREGDSQK